MSRPAWQSKTVGDLVKFSGGSQPPKSSFSSKPQEGSVRLIQIRDYKSNGFATYIPRRLARKFCSVDDVMIGRYGPPIFQILSGLEGAYNVALIKAIPNGEVTKKYLYYFLQQERLFLLIDRLSRRSAGQAGVDLDALREFEFPLPDITEQDSITEILDAWKRGVETLQQLLVLKRERKRGLMQNLLTGQKRFRDFSKRKWTHCALGEVVESVTRPVEWNESDLYRLASVRRNSGGVFSREELFGHQIKVKKLQTINTGDFLISHIQAAYGAMALVPDEFDGAKVSELYTILRPKDARAFDIRFLAYLGQTKRMWYMAIQASNGFFAERLRLNFDPQEFLRLPVSVPPTLEEQVKIVNVLSACDCEIELLEKQLKAFTEQKRGMMQKLLTGEIRVNVAKKKDL